MEKLRIALDKGAMVPTRAHDSDAGLDLYLKEPIYVPPEGARMADTGVHVAIPEGHVGLVIIRSSIGFKRLVGLSNDVGVIDSHFRGSIKLPLINNGKAGQSFGNGERIAQLVIVPCSTPVVEVVDALDDTDRADGGFGSTGR